MEANCKDTVQQKVSEIQIKRYESLHTFSDVPNSFLPWETNLSPSALYNCSLPLRKANKIKTPETKWISIKRWSTSTPSGVKLPPGVYYSIKRHEVFENIPEPKFVKTEFALILLPYGNVFSQIKPGVPITEEWLFEELEGKMMIERLMDKDAASPIPDYFKSVFNYMKKNPDQIGIHLRRKNKRGDA